MVVDRVFTQGTDGVKTTTPLLSADGPIQNLDSATITLLMHYLDIEYTVSCTVKDVYNSIVEFELSSVETSVPGDFLVQFKVEWPDKTIFVPDPGFMIFRIQPEIIDTYCTVLDVYRKAGIDNTVIPEADVYEHILDAQAEVDEHYGKSFKGPETISEWFDTADDETSSMPEKGINVLFLSKGPITEIQSVEAYDIHGNVEKTYGSDEYWINNDTGELRLKERFFAKQYYRIKIVYTYGYSKIPRLVRKLTSVIASMSMLVQQIGGTYDVVTSYSLPTGVSVGVGQPYMNMVNNVRILEKELETIMDKIGWVKTNVVIV